MAHKNGSHKEIEEKKGKEVFFGILLIVVGIIALWALTTRIYATFFFLGWIFLIGGLIRILQAFGRRAISVFSLDLFIGLLVSMGGVLLISNSGATVATATLLFALIFMVEGFAAVVSSLAIRYTNWGWYFAYGVLTFFFGVAVWRHWPTGGIFLIGLFIGLELIISGIALLAGSISPQRSSSPTITAVRI